jgi:putative membrane protein
MTAYAWLKTLHVVFVVGWFAGLFYLPRIYVNLADSRDDGSHPRLLAMARKLLKFMTGLGFLAVALGMVLLGGYGVGANAGWMYAKLVLVLGVVVYHAYCAVLYRRVASGSDNRSASWYRWYNEIPVLMLFAIVALVIGKPF